MITTLKGDIARLDFDIIINAANTSLTPGTGVCASIFAGAGPELEQECIQLRGCEVGKAKMTDPYNLRCKKIIHAVGPMYKDGKHNESKLLASAYWNSVVLAYSYMIENRLNSITLAFPCISTGAYGYPNDEACKIAVSTIRSLMQAYPDAKDINIVFVCDTEEDYMLYKKELRS